MESTRSSTQTLMTTSSIIVETLVFIPFVEESEPTIIYWWKRLLFTIFCGFRKVRFQRYRPQLKWNQSVLQLKQ